MTELQEYLEAAGFGERKSQTALFEHLIRADRQGVVAQAGTGTGKSAAIISAAAHKARQTARQSIIVTPTLTLMNQYRDGDMPVAEKAFKDLAFAELRGRSHYWCEMTKSGYDVMGIEYLGGCDGVDAGCSLKGWSGHDTDCPQGCDFEHEIRWHCEYQAAKAKARGADVVVTNADMLIVNDKILAPLDAQIFDLDGALYVDEAHTLEQKLRDYASRSLFWKSAERFKFAGQSGPRLANWLRQQEKNVTLKEVRGFPMGDLIAIANAEMPQEYPKDGLSKQREVREACSRILDYINDPHDSAVLHVNGGSLKWDWINVARSAGELLTQRDFGLVSATVPRSMSATLGVADAPFIDVGHPFDYKRAWLGFSGYAGDYRSAQSENNLIQRVNELEDLLRRSKGGALVLFSSFKDLEEVSERLRPMLMREMGLKVLVQDRDMEASDRQALADEFKSDGNAVLFGSESFATGFDVPGDALRLVVIWKLPYPALDPVSNAIKAQSYQRYEDIMKVRAVQAMGRLIRTTTDSGVVFWCDSRARRLVDSSDNLTSHIPEFSRLP